MVLKASIAKLFNRLKKDRFKTIALGILVLVIIGATVYWVYIKNNKVANKSEIAVTEDVPQTLATFEEFGLKIDSLKISAPIVPDVDGLNEKIYYAALKKGVAQFKGSFTPDKPGNLFVFGHSSFFKGVEGKYKEVFKDLNQLKPDDKIMVYYNKTPYLYKVTKSYETDDTDWTLLDPTPKDAIDKTLTLMTCWPPGTITKRWGIVATQI